MIAFLNLIPAMATLVVAIALTIDWPAFREWALTAKFRWAVWNYERRRKCCKTL